MIKFLRFFMVYLTLSYGLMPQAAAPIKEGSLIQDAEIEEILKEMISPLFQAAGLQHSNLKLYVVASSEINAAASLNFSLFINTGLIIKAKNVGQLIGVLAHETGHIAGGHMARTHDHMQKSALITNATTVLGIAAMLAGAQDASLGLLMGGSAAAQGNFLHYSRGQEAAADQAALRILDKLKWPVIGLKEFFDYLSKQEFYSLDKQDDYLFTHPLSSERINLIKDHLNHHLGNSTFPTNFEFIFERMVAKIFAYMSPPMTTFLKYPQTRKDFAALYARAIAYHRNNETHIALTIIDDLMHNYRDDPYLYELKGQIYLEQGDMMKAYDYFKRALALRPNSALIHLELLQIESELEIKKPQRIINELKTLKAHEPENIQLWQLLAIAYGRLGDEGQAAFALAEKAMYLNDIEQAKKQVKRALHFLKPGPERIAAQDLSHQLKVDPDLKQ